VGVERAILASNGAAMSVSTSLRRGVYAANRAKKLWLIFYAALTLAAAIPVAGLMGVVFASLGHSAWAEQLGRSLDIEWIGELIAAYGAMPAQPFMAEMVGALAISSLLHVFLLGGALDLFVARQHFGAADFFAACGRYFWRLFRLALYSLIAYGIVMGLGAALAAIGDKVWGEGSEAAPLIHFGWFRAALVLLLLGLVNLIFDYASIRLVAENGRKPFRLALGSFRFVWRHFGATSRLAAALWAIKLAIVAVYFGVSRLLPQASMGPVVLLLLVRQVTVLARIWSRLLFVASQAEMYDGLTGTDRRTWASAADQGGRPTEMRMAPL
jgi:hypothetical protein